jgi:hypothetical protein
LTLDMVGQSCPALCCVHGFVASCADAR